MEFIAGFLAVLIIGVPFGLVWGAQGTAARIRARATTLEQYCAEFDKWRRQIESYAGPLAMVVFLCMGLGAFTAFYEFIKQTLLHFL